MAIGKKPKDLKAILNACEDYLQEQGYKHKRDSQERLFFKMNGLNFVLFYEEEDESYIKLSAYFHSTEFPSSRATLLEHINTLNAQRKVIKAYVDQDDDVDFSVEMFLGPSMDFMTNFERMVDLIETSANSFYRTFEHDEEDKFPFDGNEDDDDDDDDNMA